jgi:hypothetical protein
MKIYLIPTVKASNGKTILEYRIVEAKRDMRKKFCKENENNIVTARVIASAVAKCNVIIKGERVILPSADEARKFSEEIRLESEVIK